MNLQEVMGQEPMGQEDRRAVERTPVQNALGAMTNHMHEIKRALDSNNIQKARALVDGAIKAFSQGG